jgi:SHS2 domain-containing protein
MYNFLEEILFIMDTEAFVLASVRKLKIDKENFELKAELVGDSPKKYEFHLDIKAITYNEMFVREENKKWVAQVVLDV